MYHSVAITDARHANAGASCGRVTCDDIMALIAKEKRLTIILLKHPLRCRANAALARQLAMYLSHTMLGISLQDVGEAFGRYRTTVSYACRQIEDLRDNRDFDRDVCVLEAKIAALMEQDNA